MEVKFVPNVTCMKMVLSYHASRYILTLISFYHAFDLNEVLKAKKGMQGFICSLTCISEVFPLPVEPTNSNG